MIVRFLYLVLLIEEFVDICMVFDVVLFNVGLYLFKEIYCLFLFNRVVF